MRHQFVVFAAAIILLLSACGSNQTASINQPDISNQKDIHKAVEIIPQQKIPTIPIDGRLRDEHLQMYVSVKIKEEQLRYEAESADSNVHIAKVADQSVADSNQKPPARQQEAINSPSRYEKKAIEEFEFNSNLYLWAKQTIYETLSRSPVENTLSKKRASNFTEYVVNHNLRMINKYRDQLQFVENYKLHPPTSIVQHAAKIGPEVEDRPKALILLPSS
ncbi:hypothetical protein [Kaarinaea lacus]